jgi:hypothetical protein
MSEQPPPSDPFELLKKMWAPFGLPMAGAAMPLGSVSEIERRIAELKSVEQWLNLNLSVLRITMQNLELQKATLAAFGATKSDAAAEQPSAANVAEAWWNMVRQQMQPPPPPPQKPEKPKK